MNNASHDAALQIQALTSLFNNRVISVSEFRLQMDTVLAAVIALSGRLEPCYDGAVTDCGGYSLRVVRWSAR
jgi:hypothetical protein